MWALSGLFPATFCVLASGAANGGWMQPSGAAADGVGGSSRGKQQHPSSGLSS